MINFKTATSLLILITFFMGTATFAMEENGSAPDSRGHIVIKLRNPENPKTEEEKKTPTTAKSPSFTDAKKLEQAHFQNELLEARVRHAEMKAQFDKSQGNQRTMIRKKLDESQKMLTELQARYQESLRPGAFQTSQTGNDTVDEAEKARIQEELKKSIGKGC